MILHTFKEILKTAESYGEGILDEVDLHNQYCGLFRCPLNEAERIMPDLVDLFHDAHDMLLNEGHDPDEWEVDLKIHMLMKDQYPCIPNFHCDNVPREDGNTCYDKVIADNKPMYLWVSDSPTTQFLESDWDTGDFVPNSHSELADYIKANLGVEDNDLKLKHIPPQTWVSMDQHTPHRGTKSKINNWRVFVRLTHKSILPARKVDNSYIRRHCQVYLNADSFSW